MVWPLKYSSPNEITVLNLIVLSQAVQTGRCSKYNQFVLGLVMKALERMKRNKAPGLSEVVNRNAIRFKWSWVEWIAELSNDTVKGQSMTTGNLVCWHKFSMPRGDLQFLHTDRSKCLQHAMKVVRKSFWAHNPTTGRQYAVIVLWGQSHPHPKGGGAAAFSNIWGSLFVYTL